MAPPRFCFAGGGGHLSSTGVRSPRSSCPRRSSQKKCLVMSVPEEMVALSHSLADIVRETVRPYFRSGVAIEAKDDRSPVTAADRAAEKAMREILAAKVPEHGIVGEEFGSDVNLEDTEYVWVLDPIDGTKAFMTGKPTFGTLIALMRNGKPILGIIDQPITRERWIGVEGEGSRLNGTLISCMESQPKRLSEANLHATHPDMFTGIDRMSFEELSAACRYTLYGSDCYAYALLASGHAHIVCEADMKPYDYMALIPVIKEAGGVITDWRGNELGMDSDGSVLAAVSETLHREALELLLASPKGLILLQEGDKRAGSGESLDDIDDSFPEEPVTEAGACSMSGFGTGIANKDNITVKVDIKSLNGRYFDASIKSPRAVNGMEPKLQTYLRQELQRGNIVMKIDVKDKDAAVLPIQVDEAAVRSARLLLDQVSEIAGVNEPPVLESILRFSEVFVKKDLSPVDPRVLPLVEEAVVAAVADLKAVRRREGYVLQLDLLRRCKTIELAIEDISKRIPVLIQRQKTNAQLTSEALKEEVIDFKVTSELETFMSNRVDVTEEVVRLKSHLSVFKISFFTSRPIGQKLNFLVQEINREAITIGTKANDAPVSQIAVIIREELEKIREQIQNIV